jgi:hypothetical protein
MARLFLYLLVFGLLAVNSNAADEATNSEDAAVLSVIAQSMCASLASRGETRYLVLSDESEQIKSDGGKKSLGRDAVASLVSRNSAHYPLPKITLCPGIRLFKAEVIRSAEQKFIENDDYISGFRQAFPGAFGPTDMSLPGYTENATRALVVVSNAGGSFYYVLFKKNGKWHIEKTVFRSIA